MMLNCVPPRKRIERACDQCRRRKTKCSGKATCKTCIDLRLECSYGSKLKQSRGGEYVAYLERTNKALNARILNDQIRTGSNGSSLAIESSPRPSNQGSSESESRNKDGSYSYHSPSASEVAPRRSLRLEGSDFLESIGADMDDRPFFNRSTSCCYGISSGIEVIRRMRLLVESRYDPSTDDRYSPSARLASALDRRVPMHVTAAPLSMSVFSPSKSELLQLIDVAFSKAYVFISCIDRSHVEIATDHFYGNANLTSPNAGSDHMAILYAVVALGELLDGSSNRVNLQSNERSLKGKSYFKASRYFVDPLDCSRSLAALQAVLCQAVYLVAASSLATAHGYISSAVTASFHLGMHQKLCLPNIRGREHKARGTTFRCLKALEIYVTSFLGLPSSLQAIHVEYQANEQPIEGQEDWHIVSKAHFDLLDVLGESLHYAYFSGQSVKNGGIYHVASSVIHECETNFAKWRASMSFLWEHPSDSTPCIGFISRIILDNEYALARLVFYSPFSHYLAKSAGNRSAEGYNAALTCVEAAIQMIDGTALLTDAGFSDAFQPFMLHGLTLAATVLLLAELTADSLPTITEVIRARATAAKLFTTLASVDVAAMECMMSLLPLYHSETPRVAMDRGTGNFGHTSLTLFGDWTIKSPVDSLHDSQHSER